MYLRFMNKIEINFKGFKILLQDKELQFPMKEWSCENNADLIKLELLKVYFEKFRVAFSNHKESGRVKNITFSENRYNTILNIAIGSLQKLKQEFKANEIVICFEGIIIRTDANLSDDTVVISGYQSV